MAKDFGKGKTVKGASSKGVFQDKLKGKGKGDRPKGKGKGKDKPLDDEAKSRLREEHKAEVDAFFGALPDTLTADEEMLRDALVAVVADAGGSARLSMAASHEEVKAGKTALNLPKGTLMQWINQRVSGELAILTGEGIHEPMLCIAGNEADAEAMAKQDPFEDFFNNLPEDSFLDGELALREKVVEQLERLGGRAKMSALVRGEGSRDMAVARSAVLPKGAPLQDWIERRMGGEVNVIPEPHGGNLLELVNMPKTTVKGAGKAGKAGKSEGGSAKGAGKESKKGPPVFDEEVAREKEEARLAREARAEEWISTLPDDALSVEEQGLRTALMSTLETAVRGEMRLSVACQGTEVRAAKAALNLPADVSIGMWIASRIGGEIILDQSEGPTVARLVQAPAQPAKARLTSAPQNEPRLVKTFEEKQAEREASVALKEERDARMVEFFQGPLSREEEALRRALHAACTRSRGPARLSDFINTDPAVGSAWRAAKALWLSASPPVEAGFSRWVELRMSDEVRITREPYVQLTKQELERLGLGKRRPQDLASDRAAKVPRLGGVTGSKLGAAIGGGSAIGSRPAFSSSRPGAYAGKGSLGSAVATRPGMPRTASLWQGARKGASTKGSGKAVR